MTSGRYNQGLQVTAIIAAGGRGERLGGRALKQLLPIAGRAMLDRSVSAFLTHPDITEVIVALPQTVIDDPPAYLRGGKSLRLVAGGRSAAGLGGERVPRRSARDRGHRHPRRGAAVRHGRPDHAHDRRRGRIGRRGGGAAGARHGQAAAGPPNRPTASSTVIGEDAGARDDLSRANAPGIPARGAGRGFRLRGAHQCGGHRRSGAGRGGWSSGAPCRRGRVEHQDHDAGGSRRRRRHRAWLAIDGRSGPGAPVRATTCIGWPQVVR